MALPRTEMLHDAASGLDTLPPVRIAAALAQVQADAAHAAETAAPAIAQASDAMAMALHGDGRLIYAAAGSSGLMAAADALEISGTFGIDPARIRILLAGGLPTDRMPGAVEDETDTLARDMADLHPQDAVIAVSASGTTPYAVAAARLARGKGATVIGIANNPGTPLLQLADHPILLPTPPELIAGSTRMGAGTAQKIALNMLSTLMAVRLGHVHDGMMVNVVADNDKLRRRAAGMVAAIAGVPEDQAQAALQAAQGQVKPAVLIARAGLALEAAEARLQETNGYLRAALARL